MSGIVQKLLAKIALLILVMIPSFAFAFAGATPGTVTDLNGFIPGTGDTCKYNVYHYQTGAAATVVLFYSSAGTLDVNIMSTPAGSTWDDSGWATARDGVDDGKLLIQAVSAADLETYCGLTNVSIVSQTGTATSYAADSYAGVTFRATATDGKYYEYEYGLTGASGTTTIVRQTPFAVPPVAVATGPATVESGTTGVELNGSGSTVDPSRLPLTYSWTQDVGASTQGYTVALTNPTSATPTFDAPTLAIGASNVTLVYDLIVHDGTESSPKDS
ncbi:MAG TPA: hypothetical protein VLA51_07490, partial [Paracoccaceae bacterium]|nr:hypothetical protein [Paracoccaceae bacterium]